MRKGYTWIKTSRYLGGSTGGSLGMANFISMAAGYFICGRQEKEQEEKEQQPDNPNPMDFYDDI
jgi:hypothetical protein